MQLRNWSSSIIILAFGFSFLLLSCTRYTTGRTSIRSFVLGNIMAQDRLDRGPGHRAQFEKNKKRIFATQSVCAICGKPVDFNLKYPHPLSPTIDHIIPLAKGGHPSDIDNLQLAHRCCNRQKSDKLVPTKASDTKQQVVSNRILPATYDWYSHPPKLIAK